MAKLFGNSKDKKEKDFTNYRVNQLNKLLMRQYFESITNKVQTPAGYPGWSPNNVKRVIISPDGVCVEYHTTTVMNGAKKRYDYKVFDVESTMQCLNSPKAKSILSVFSDNRVYSAIEEIVILTKSMQGLTLRGDELDLSGIGIQNKADMKKSLESRYRRLVHIVLIEDVDIQTLLTNTYGNKAVYQEFTTIYDIYRELTNGGGKATRLKVGGSHAYSNMPNLRGFSSKDGKGYYVDMKEEEAKAIGVSSGDLRRYFEGYVDKYDKKIRSEIAERNGMKGKKETDYKIPSEIIENAKVCARAFRLTLGLYSYLDKFFNTKNVREIMVKDLGHVGTLANNLRNILSLSGTKYERVQKEYLNRTIEKMGYLDFKGILKKINIEGAFKCTGDDVKSLFCQIDTVTRTMSDEERYQSINEGMKYFTVFLTNGVIGVFDECLASCKLSKTKMYNTIFDKIANEKFYLPKADETERYAFKGVGALFNEVVEVDRTLDECLVLDSALVFYLYSNLFMDRKKVKLEAVKYPKWKSVLEKEYRDVR